MSEKDRKVTSVGVVKESSELIKEREVAKQGGKWADQPTPKKKAAEADKPKKEQEEEKK